MKGSVPIPSWSERAFKKPSLLENPESSCGSLRKAPESALPVGFRGDGSDISAWKNWAVATVARPEGARDKLKEE